MLGPDDDIYIADNNQRGKLVTRYSTLAVTAYQRVYQALTVKARNEDRLGPF